MVNHADYVQTLMGPDTCPHCWRIFDQLWELVCGTNHEPVDKACPSCARELRWEL